MEQRAISAARPLLLLEAAGCHTSDSHRIHLELRRCLTERHPAKRGRPPFTPDRQTVEYLLNCGLTYKDIAPLYDVCSKTVQHYCANNGLGKRKREQTTDEELQAAVAELTAGIGASWGLRMALGYLRGSGLVVARERVRDALKEANPDGLQMRRRQAVQRRVYRVAGPNALWHVDGHHKLAPWGIYVHGENPTCTYVYPCVLTPTHDRLY